jgi:HD-GYP domain-containing protein (c-di-GMP phosphodiesterase class II)
MALHHLIISAGMAFIVASIYQSRKLRAFVPLAQRQRWRILECLMLFFLLGYAAELFSSTRIIVGPFQYLVSFVYLGGAVFVFTTMKMSRLAILHIKRDESRISKLHEEMQHAYNSTIEGWGRALELRDKETEGHTQRVCAMTMTLAARFQFTAEELQYIKFGALLHDIGKMGVPDSILLNEGILTSEEKAIMRHHPDYARAMLDGITFLKPAMDIPYCHHEYWDGSGYPQGLKGEAIPLAARIFAVADVWDALSNERRYHAAWTSDRVCDHIRCAAGSHFDPQVVIKFLELDLCDLTANTCAPDS